MRCQCQTLCSWAHALISVSTFVVRQAVLALIENVTFRDSESNEQVRGETLLNERKHRLVSSRKWRYFIQTASRKILCHINKVMWAVDSLGKCLDLDRIVLKVNCHIQELYYPSFSPNSNVSLGVENWSFGISEIVMD